MNRLIRLPGAMLVVLGALACDEKLSTLAGPTPNLEPTFASIQSQVFETTDSAGRTACITSHTNVGRNLSSGLNLTHDVAYDQLVGVPSRNKPGAIRVCQAILKTVTLCTKSRGGRELLETGCRTPGRHIYPQVRS